MADVEQLKAALIKAHSEGDTQAAELFASRIKEMQAQPVQQSVQQGVGQQQQPATLAELEPTGPLDIVQQAISEPLLAIPGAIGGLIASGYASLPQLMMGDADGATETQKEVMSAISEFTAPRTEAGQASIQAIGKIGEYLNIPVSGLSGLAELMAGQGVEQAAQTVQDVQDKGFGDAFADRVFEETGDPLYATMAKASPELIGSFFMLRGVRGSKRVKEAQRQQELVARIQRGEETADLAPLKVERLPDHMQPKPSEVKLLEDKLGRDQIFKDDTNTALLGVTKDKLALEAQKQGFEPAVLASVKAGSDLDKSAMRRMIDVLEKGRKDERFRALNRPSDVLGDSIMRRVAFLQRLNKDAGKAVEITAKKLKGKPVEFGSAVDDFVAKLTDDGVRFDDNMMPIFEYSRFEGSTGAERLIRNVFKRMTGKTKELDALDIHNMKKFIDEQVEFGKKSATGLSGRAEIAVKGLRKGLDNALDEAFPEYNKANTIYADSIDPLNKIKDAVAAKIDITSPTANKALGQELRKILTNYASRDAINNAVNALDDVSIKYGANFADDIVRQTIFVNALDRRFGAAGRGTLAGTIESAGKRAVGAIPTAGPEAEIAKRAVGGVLDKMRGVNDEAALKAIKDLLEK